MKNFRQRGDTLTHIAASDINSGDPVLVDSIIGIAVTDIATGDTGELKMEGVFELPKVAGAIDQGAPVNLDTGEITIGAGDFAGTAWTNALSGDATVWVKINFGQPGA